MRVVKVNRPTFTLSELTPDEIDVITIALDRMSETPSRPIRATISIENRNMALRLSRDIQRIIEDEDDD